MYSSTVFENKVMSVFQETITSMRAREKTEQQFKIISISPDYELGIQTVRFSDKGIRSYVTFSLTTGSILLRDPSYMGVL